MAGLDVQVKGVSKAMGRLRVVLNEEIRRGVEEAVGTTAVNVDRTAKRLISEPGSGRTYTRGGVQHQASAPGEAPASDTGQLRASGHVEKPAPLRRKVVFDAGHAPHLEFGTRHMAARPFLGPAWESEREDCIRRVKDALRGK